MVYNWDDLMENRFEVVEWGDNVRRTRRERVLNNMSPLERRNKLISSTVVVISTAVALGIAVMVALTLVGPMPEPEGGGDGANKAEGMGSLPSLTIVEKPIRPTTTPTIATSLAPSILASKQPSASPSYLSSMVPSTAPSFFCLDEPGLFENHDGDQVSCEWFATVNTYSFVSNCGKTALGKACMLSCREYNSCVIATVSPSSQPSSTSSPSISKVPTPGPPTNITLLATGDAMVNEGAPNATLGSSSWLKIIAAASSPAANVSLQEESNNTMISSFVRDSNNSSAPKSIAAMVRDFSNTSANQSIAAMVRDYSIKATTPTTIAPAVIDSSNHTDQGSSASRGFIHHSADDGAFHVLIRFNISAYDATRSVSSANLLLKAANSCTSGMYLTQTSTNWNETSITWDNAPIGDGIEVNRLVNITSGHLYLVNVTTVFTMPTRQRQKALSFRLYPIGTEECLFVSKDNKNGGGPKLQIIYDAVYGE